MVNKAVLLAATRDANADGRIGKANTWSANAPNVDAEDGAGQIDFVRLKQVLDNNTYWWANVSDSSFSSCGTNCKELTVATLSVPASTAVRAALAWHSCMIAEGSMPVLNNDLDLVLSCGSALQVCGGSMASTTVTSEMEMLERPGCTYAKTCSLKVRVKNGAAVASCGTSTTERVGVAWSFRDEGGGNGP